MADSLDLESSTVDQLGEFEPEQEDSDVEVGITEPFDPAQIKIETRTILIQQVVSRVAHGEIDLEPEFQRLHGIWDPTRRSRLIESILLRIPLPVFYVAADVADSWAVIDGVQRLSTICDFSNGEFALKNLEYLHGLNGQFHDDLPRGFQRRIGEASLVVHVIQAGTPEEVMQNIFLRINTGGLTLNAQEIRHALYPGPVRKYLLDLSRSSEFIDATGRLNPKRMLDRECVLRFLAFTLTDPDEYRANDLNRFLGVAMQVVNNLDDNARADLASTFKEAMRAAKMIFGSNAFRKPPGPSGRFPVNRALFEAWGVNLGKCTPEQINLLIEDRDKVSLEFCELMNIDAEFDRAISYSTGNTLRVRKRFRAIRELIEELI